MSDYILTDGDPVVFEPDFQGSTVTPTEPSTLTASGAATFRGRQVCVEGDEASASVDATYVTPTHTTPGSGTIEITGLANDQIASKTYSRGLLVLMVGGHFEATFTPQKAATDPATGAPDALTPRTGRGFFEPEPTTFKGV